LVVVAGQRFGGHDRAHSLWLYGNGTDRFAPLDDVTDLWEVMAPRVSPRAR
jgi:hypothetical protein